MKTVKEVSQLTGVSVRTLHHYDALGLPKPTRVTEAGYRLYDDAAQAKAKWGASWRNAKTNQNVMVSGAAVKEQKVATAFLKYRT